MKKKIIDGFKSFIYLFFLGGTKLPYLKEWY